MAARRARRESRCCTSSDDGCLRMSIMKRKLVIEIQRGESPKLGATNCQKEQEMWWLRRWDDVSRKGIDISKEEARELQYLVAHISPRLHTSHRRCKPPEFTMSSCDQLLYWAKVENGAYWRSTQTGRPSCRTKRQINCLNVKHISWKCYCIK